MRQYREKFRARFTALGACIRRRLRNQWEVVYADGRRVPMEVVTDQFAANCIKRMDWIPTSSGAANSAGVDSVTEFRYIKRNGPEL